MLRGFVERPRFALPVFEQLREPVGFLVHDVEDGYAEAQRLENAAAAAPGGGAALSVVVNAVKQLAADLFCELCLDLLVATEPHTEVALRGSCGCVMPLYVAHL